MMDGFEKYKTNITDLKSVKDVQLGSASRGNGKQDSQQREGKV